MGADSENKPNFFVKFTNAVGSVIDGPVVWFRKSVVESNRQVYPWYHQKLRRVPTIDECYADDSICKFEANQQFKRDKLVENEILTVLRLRYEDCVLYEGPEKKTKCQQLKQQYDEAVDNWFIKYGDLGAYGDAEAALMKQKHRLIWERRHGPVGSGMKSQVDEE